MIVGTSTSCSTSCVTRTGPRAWGHRKQDLGHFDNLLRIRRECGEELRNSRQLGPPSAAQEQQVQARAYVPQRAAEPVLGGEALPERGRVVHHVPLPGPCRLLALCAMVRWTRQGPLRPPTARDASASGGVAVSGGGHSLCRRLHLACSHQQRGHPLGPEKAGQPN